MTESGAKRLEDDRQTSGNSIYTIGFGVGPEELEWIILAALKQSPRHKCAVKALFRKVLSHLQINPRGEKREELLEVFVRHLRLLKEQKKIEFISAKTKVHVSLL